MAKKGVTRGTTPNLIFRVPFKVTSIVELLGTFTQSGKIIEGMEKHLADVEVNEEKNSVCIRLTEDETLALDPDKDLVYDMKVLLNSGDVVASRKIYMEVYDTQNATKMGAL